MEKINNLITQSSILRKEEFDNDLKLKFAAKKIAFKIFYALKSKNYSQKDLAEKLNVSPQNISKMLKGEDFKISTLIKFEDALDINLIDRDIHSRKNLQINLSIEFKTTIRIKHKNQLPQSPVLLKEKFVDGNSIFEQNIYKIHNNYESLLQQI